MKEVSAIFLINKKNEYLLQLRDPYVIDGDKWSLFGGSIEKNETPEEAIVREIKEEINFNLKEFKKINVLHYKNLKVHLFKGKIDKPLSSLKLTEGKDFNFFKKKDIYNLNTPLILKKYLPLINSTF